MDIKNQESRGINPLCEQPARQQRGGGRVASSIAEFGFKVPIIVDRNNVVVTGHTRLQALKSSALQRYRC